MKHFPCRSGYWVWDRIRRYPVACREKPAITKPAFGFEANVLLKQQALQKYTCRTTNPIKVLHCASIWRFYCQRGSIDTAIKRWWRHNVTAGPFLWKIKTLPCYFVSINHSWLTNLTITEIDVNIKCRLKIVIFMEGRWTVYNTRVPFIAQFWILHEMRFVL